MDKEHKEQKERGRPLKQVVIKYIPDTDGYCRKCRQIKSLSNFYESSNVYLDASGYMSICTVCCNMIYNYHLKMTDSVDKSIHNTCRDLDLRYSVDAVNATKSHMEKTAAKGQSVEKIFGTYKSKLFSLMPKNTGVEGTRYQDSDKPVFGTNDLGTSVNQEKDLDTNEDSQMFWGVGFDTGDILYLENELSLWKFQYKCDNQALIILFKEICIKTLEIRKLRAESKPTQKAVEELQKLMNTAGVDPARAKDIDSDKNKDAYGLWIKDIEETEPAEYFEDKKMFSDYDSIKKYVEAFIFRPLRNLLLGSRDFNIGEFDTNSQAIDVNEPEDEVYDTLDDEESEEGDYNAN